MHQYSLTEMLAWLSTLSLVHSSPQDSGSLVTGLLCFIQDTVMRKGDVRMLWYLLQPILGQGYLTLRFGCICNLCCGQREMLVIAHIFNICGQISLIWLYSAVISHMVCARLTGGTMAHCRQWSAAPTIFDYTIECILGFQSAGPVSCSQACAEYTYC